MPKGAGHESRALMPLSARYHSADIELLESIAKASRVDKSIYPRTALRLLIDMYQRDGEMSFPAIVVPLKRALEGPLSVESLSQNDGEHRDSTTPRNFGYYVDDLDILKKICTETGILPAVYLRMALRMLLDMYRRDGVLTLPAVMLTFKKAREGSLKVEEKKSTSQS
jgi:hypothetical protein